MSLSPHIRRSLLVIILILMAISVTRLLVTMHQQQERIEILESQVSQLLADTTRLILPAYQASQPRREWNTTPPHRTVIKHNNNAPQSTVQNSVAIQQSAVSESSETPAPPANRHKFTEVHQFDLNTIDSATLTRIPGIAERTASTILKHRLRYGGFSSPWQLQEFLTWDAALAYMEEWCTQWFTADASRIRRININEASVSELQRHPYIDHNQAIEIARYRTRHKSIKTTSELEQLPSFTPEQLQQLQPYITLE